MSKAVIFFAPGLEECEGLLCVDLLRRSGVEVTIAAVGGEKIVKSARSISVVADALAEELDSSGLHTVDIFVENMGRINFGGQIQGERKGIRGPITLDGNIITGEALGAAIPFALALASRLAGQQASNAVKQGIVYRY